MWWKEPVTTLKGVGVKKAAELAALNIFSVGDLLEFYPHQFHESNDEPTNQDNDE